MDKKPGPANFLPDLGPCEDCVFQPARFFSLAFEEPFMDGEGKWRPGFQTRIAYCPECWVADHADSAVVAPSAPI